MSALDLRAYRGLPTYEQQRAAAGAGASRVAAAAAPSPGAADPGADPAQATVGDLARRLAAADIADPRVIESPGAVVVLPWGVELVARLRADVDAAYSARGYEVHEFPEIAPESVYAPALAAFPDAQHLLYVADAGELARGEARGVLSPTGESMVYRYWARRVRTRADLPLRLCRNARYFRPVPSGHGRAGRGVLRPMEAADVHEFHAAFLDHDEASNEVDRTLAMVAEVVRAWHVPVLWSMRPPWTNNGGLYRAALGADTVLPTGDTLQVGVVYDQGDVFSRAFDIRVRDTDPHRHPFHVTGCVTRRLLYAHVFQADRPDGPDHAAGPLLHPDVAPVTVVVRGASADALAAVTAAVSARGHRVREVVASGPETRAVEQRWRRRGVPVQVLVQEPRHPDDPARVVVSSPGREDVVLRGGLGAVVERTTAAVDDAVGHAVAAQRGRVDRMWDVVERVSPDRVRDVVANGGVAVVGLSATESAVAELEQRSPGEVLGLVPAAEPVTCAVTGEQVSGYALVGRRA